MSFAISFFLFFFFFSHSLDEYKLGMEGAHAHDKTDKYFFINRNLLSERDPCGLTNRSVLFAKFSDRVVFAMCNEIFGKTLEYKFYLNILPSTLSHLTIDYWHSACRLTIKYVYGSENAVHMCVSLWVYIFSCCSIFHSNWKTLITSIQCLFPSFVLSISYGRNVLMK